MELKDITEAMYWLSLWACVVAHQVLMIIDTLLQPQVEENNRARHLYSCIFIILPNLLPSFR